jgi:hypothetical protein
MPKSPKWYLLLSFSPKILNAFHMSLTLPDLLTRNLFGEECKFRRFSVCIFQQRDFP